MIERLRKTIDARYTLAAVACTAVLIAACDASYPTQPSAPVPVNLQLQFANAVGIVTSVPRTFFSMRTYVIRSDGAWEDVTGRTKWSSSDPFVLAPFGAGSFNGERPGTAGVRAEYEGLHAFIEIVVVDPAQLTLPRLFLTPAAPQTPGLSLTAKVELVPATGSSRDVTAEAAWVSSDPSVATVDRGRVTATDIGTTRITVNYQGFTASYVFSVPPPAK